MFYSIDKSFIRRQYFVPFLSIVVASTSVVFMLSISSLCLFSELELIESSSLVTQETMVLKFCCIVVIFFVTPARSRWVLVNFSVRFFFIVVITNARCCCVLEVMCVSRSLRGTLPHAPSLREGTLD